MRKRRNRIQCGTWLMWGVVAPRVVLVLVQVLEQHLANKHRLLLMEVIMAVVLHHHHLMLTPTSRVLPLLTLSILDGRCLSKMNWLYLSLCDVNFEGGRLYLYGSTTTAECHSSLITQQNKNPPHTLVLSLIILHYIKRHLLYLPFLFKDTQIVVVQGR